MTQILFILVNFVAPAAAQTSVLIDAPREHRQIIEIVDPERVSYRVCRRPDVADAELLKRCRRVGPDLPNTPGVRETLRAEFARALAEALVVYDYETTVKTVGTRVVRDSLIYTGVQMALVRALRGPLGWSGWLERGGTAYAAWVLGHGLIDGGGSWGRRRHLATLRDFQVKIDSTDRRAPPRLITAPGVWPRPSTEMQVLLNALRHALVITNAGRIVEGD